MLRQRRRRTTADEIWWADWRRTNFQEQPERQPEQGTGRSTRFLQQLGFETVGLDISAEMVAIARARDPNGDNRVIEDGDFTSLPVAGSDLVLSAFTFDNIPVHRRRVALFMGLRNLARPEGLITVRLFWPRTAK